MSHTKSIGWGTRITILYLGFVGLIATLVILSHREKPDLVTPEYYSEELKYQERINAISNLENSGSKISLEETKNSVILSVPEFFSGKEITGEAHFYRPSNSAQDVKMKLTIPASETKHEISVDKFQKGAYILKLNFTSEGKNYYQQESIYIE